MIRSVKIENYLGDVLEMDLTRPEESGFAIANIEGIGPETADVNISEIATMDGGTFNSSRMGARNIVFNIIFFGKELTSENGEYDPDEVAVNSESVEWIRQQSYKYFPLKRKIKILIQNDNRACEIEGYVEKNEPNIFSKQESTQISVICPNPFFYDAYRLDEVTLYGVEPLFEFPFENDSLYSPLLEMGEIKNKFFANVEYSGDDEVGITMTMVALGSIKNVRIYNLFTRGKMEINTDKIEALTGSGIIAGDEVIICTEKGNKSATLLRGGKTTNILNCINRNADWFQLAKGINQFGFTCDEGKNNLQFKVSNRILYEGV